MHVYFLGAIEAQSLVSDVTGSRLHCAERADGDGLEKRVASIFKVDANTRTLVTTRRHKPDHHRRQCLSVKSGRATEKASSQKLVVLTEVLHSFPQSTHTNTEIADHIPPAGEIRSQDVIHVFTRDEAK